MSPIDDLAPSLLLQALTPAGQFAVLTAMLEVVEQEQAAGLRHDPAQLAAVQRRAIRLASALRREAQAA